MAAQKKEMIVEIKPIEIQTAHIRIVGDSPLIMHKWSQKAMIDIENKQKKVTKTKAREIRHPFDEFLGSMYWLSEEPYDRTEEAFEQAVDHGARWGFPVTAIKQAAVNAAYRNGLTKDMVSLRGAFFIDGEGEEMLAEVSGCVPVMRRDMVRLAKGATDLRYRGMFTDWHMDLDIRYNVNGLYTLEQIINLINIGGFSCGIGEWRPEKDGLYGMFHVDAQ